MKNRCLRLPGLLMIVLLICCNVAKAADRIKRVLAEREFDVIEFAELNLDVKYGDVNIVNHSQNMIKIKVTAVLVTTRPVDAERIFDELDLQILGDEFKVSVTADPGKTNPGKGNNLMVTVDITMPETINLTLNHMFGNASIEGLAGKAVVSSRYGKFNAKRLSHEDNDLRFDFGNGKIDQITGGKVNVSYGELKIVNVTDLQLNAEYSNTNISRVGNMRLQAEGGSITIGKAEEIWLTTKFTAINVNELLNRLVANIEFGQFTVQQIDRAFTWVEINSNFANGQLGFDAEGGFNIRAEMAFATLKYPAEAASFTEKISSPSKSTFTGTIGDASDSSGDVRIKSGNGNVTISRK